MEKTLTTYTVNIYKKDARMSEGKKRVYTRDLEMKEFIEKNPEGEAGVEASLVEFYKKEFKGTKHVVEIVKTYVEKINLMTQKPYLERYDTPYHCSPSTETYWTM